MNPARLAGICLIAGLVLAPAIAATAARRPAPTAAGLPGLVKAYRQAPTAAKLAAIKSYAAAHPKQAPQARLALAVAAYEQNDFAGAIANLRQAAPKLPKIADYAAYYLAASRVEMNDLTGIARDLAPVYTSSPLSPLAAKAWLVEARALKGSDAASAVRVLRDHYAQLPQPEGDITLADCYLAAGDRANAADFYQRIYAQYVTGDASARAAAALVSLKAAMGAAYPEPLPQQALRRAGRLLDAQLYSAARDEFQAIANQAPEPERRLARARLGEVDYAEGRTPEAYRYFAGLELGESDADAERLYYMEECARRQGNDGDMMAAVERLSTRYGGSPWRQKALVSAANRYLLVDRPDDFVPLYKAAYTDFPAEPGAAVWHWKVTFQSYLQGKPGAADLLREQLRNYPQHFTAPAALYFLGRLAEQKGEFGSAKADYQRLASAFENYYYALLARQRLRDAQVAGAVAAATPQFTAVVTPVPAPPLPAAPTASTTERIERSRLLRGAGLGDQADGELRFGARSTPADGQAPLLAEEMAASADSPHLGMRAMKSLVPDYLNRPLNSAPRQFWEFLFPLPYRSELAAEAARRGLDPYLVAGLIRQESEFDPGALSHANAYGLTQVRPGTGRMYARQAGLRRFSVQSLLQPAVNLKIGTSILKGMLDKNGGRLEETLAAYNAGPNRVAQWLGWKNYREPAEFVESIPFTETRDYVQAVLRNQDMYRRLYGGRPSKVR